MKVTCGVCGAVYEEKRIKLPMRDKDEEHCECGSLLKSWNGAEMWEYTLISHGKKKNENENTSN